MRETVFRLRGFPMSFRSRTLSSVVSVLLCGASTVALADTAVFINEVHYDNDGADVGEAIEVVGPSSTDLSSWRVVLYNGSNSTAATSYSDRLLSEAAISGSCGSKQVKVLQYPQDGVQNGTADAIALVDAGGNVVQFLSYEGTATASNGPAAGMTSVDIGVSEPGTTTAGTSLQLGGSGSEYGQFSWQASGAHTFGNCNTNQSFGPAPDTAPSVLSTTPANNTGGHAVSTDITVNFSESVTVGSAWYSLSCGVSGSHLATVSGSGASRTLNPDTDFASGESCTLTVYADEVTDLDLPADPMADDFSMTFTTAGDLPPSVSATSPANNATGFPLGANLSVTFSEAVTLDNGWYTLSCNNSGSHSVQVGANGNTYTLDPTANFTALEDCTLTILADHVHDQDGTVHDMAANVVVNFETGADVADYYAGVDTSSGPALKAWLHNRIKDHTAIFYGQTYIVMNKADEDPTDTSKVWDVYKNESYPKQTSGAANYNREHTWPKSLGFPNETDGGKPVPPHTDGHMLHASHVGYNSDRGNKPYGECSSCTPRPTTANHGFGGGGGGDNNYFNGSYFEVWDHRKGDMARAVMYMVPRYQGGINANGVREPRLELTDNPNQIVAINAQGCTNGCIGYMGLLTVLLEWNEQDPPDARERLRNDTVYSFQGNRNPFIDHPEWARCVFQNTGCPSIVDAIFATGFE